jgi:predicted  nucleic acid-binding Zn-ribbon protein
VHLFFWPGGGPALREQIEILASLQNVDRDIKDKNLAKRVLTDEIKKREEEIALKKSEVARLKAEWTEKEKARREKDATLQDEARKATDKRMRMTRIKNIRELQALQHEVDQIKMQNSLTEEELIAIMEDVEARGSVLHEREEELKTLEQAWNEQKSALEAQVVEIDKQVADAASGRQSIASRLNGDLIGRYETIFRARGGTAVVGVTDGICQGCYMNIPPQLANEIRRNERLNLCPSCHRILFYKPAESTDGKHA